jgi:predicted DNA helicase
LREDARQLERQIIANILDSADVVCATTTFDPEILGKRTFDLGVIDEACQSTEPGCWPVILRSERIVLAGDHCQLPPTVLSDQAAREGFAVSMMERLFNHYGKQITRRLSVQYRMHEHIMAFSSSQFYDGVLEADDTVKNHQLSDLPYVGALAESEPIVTFIDSAGASWDEELEPDGESKCNIHEGKLVVEQVGRLLDLGLNGEDIAVISPYSAQVRWIREKLQNIGVEVDTVDGFQGREKEALLISLVRSNNIGEIGFLSDTRRMNVALTRAKRRLIVIGDSATLGGHTFYTELLQYFESIGAYTTVWEYPSVDSRHSAGN